MSDKKEEPNKIGNLKVVRINDINLVPRYLLDQVRGREWETDKVVPYLSRALLAGGLNLCVLIDKENVIKGVLLFQPNYLENNIEILILSVDREYQFNGVLPDALKFMRGVKEGYKLKSIKIRTKRPNAFEKLGLKISGFTMEIK